MRKSLWTLIAMAAVLLLSACDSSSKWFDNNCTGNGIQNPSYCTGTLHPNAGPYAAKS